MKKQVKRIVTVCLLVMTVLSVSNVFAAGNTSPWEWASGYGGTSTVITPHRVKKNATEAYIKNSHSSRDTVAIRVCGTNKACNISGKNDGINVTVKCRDNNYETYYNVHKKERCLMKNKVYEKKYKYCYLTIGVGKSNAAEGNGGPDCG